MHCNTSNPDLSTHSNMCKLLLVALLLFVLWSILSTSCQKNSSFAKIVQHPIEETESSVEKIIKRAGKEVDNLFGSSKEENPAKYIGQPDNIGSQPLHTNRGTNDCTSSDNLFELSDASKEFVAAFAPNGLAKSMPPSWRNAKEMSKTGVSSASYNSEPNAKAFDEFSRYTVTPNASHRAESLRGAMRLPELSSARNYKALGAPNYLLEQMFPTKPKPIGFANMPFLDSSARLARVAAATGEYPSEIKC